MSDAVVLSRREGAAIPTDNRAAKRHHVRIRGHSASGLAIWPAVSESMASPSRPDGHLSVRPAVSGRARQRLHLAWVAAGEYGGRRELQIPI